MNIIESIWSVYEWRRQIAVDSSWKKRQVALARSTSYYTPGVPIRNSSNFRFDFWCFLVPFTIAPTIHYLCTERFSVMRTKTFTLSVPTNWSSSRGRCWCYALSFPSGVVLPIGLLPMAGVSDYFTSFWQKTSNFIIRTYQLCFQCRGSCHSLKARQTSHEHVPGAIYVVGGWKAKFPKWLFRDINIALTNRRNCPTPDYQRRSLSFFVHLTRRTHQPNSPSSVLLSWPGIKMTSSTIAAAITTNTQTVITAMRRCLLVGLVCLAGCCSCSSPSAPTLDMMLPFSCSWTVLSFIISNSTIH